MAGIDAPSVPDWLFGFQRDLVEWALRMGRSAIFADCGLGKTPMQLVWADRMARHSDKPSLVLTPLAVSHQTVREAGKFGIDAERSQDGSIGSRLVVTNYERLGAFSPDDFGAVVCDESSILKNFAGKRRAEITEFLGRVRYRLLCTATAAPNDFTELGTSSEALGVMDYAQVLARFFTHDSGETAKWRLKGHARKDAFWRWVCSWARACRKPSDLGHDDGAFVLPPLVQYEHIVDDDSGPVESLFRMEARGLSEQRAERKRTLAARCEKVADLAGHGEQALVWCHLNAEGDRLASLIDGAEQVKGADKDDDKEARLLAFQRGDLRVLVTKPVIGAWGLNLQGCAHITFFPSHSYEQYYQGVRRCWRFGQDNPVRVDVVSSAGEAGVLANLQRKADQADEMFQRLVAHMGDAQKEANGARADVGMEVPSWL